jgi:fatty acid desaturase
VARDRYPRAAIMPDVRRLSQVSNWKSAIVIGFQWIVISTCIGLAIQFPYWWVWVPCGIILATRLQCLGVLMHDGAHYLLFTNRLVNDITSDLFLAFPLGLSTTLYRHDHFVHHRFTNTEHDPDVRLQLADSDFRWPKTRLGCLALVLRSLLGLNLYRMMKAAKAWSPWVNFFTPISPILPLRARVLLILAVVVVYTVVIWSGQYIPLLAVFVIPGLTLLNFTNRVRVTAEHMRVPATHELNSTRTVVPSWLDWLMVAPYGVSYHIEHHLFPSVPGRNLPELHRCLMTDQNFKKHAHVTYSYRGLLRELLTPASDTAEPIVDLPIINPDATP